MKTKIIKTSKQNVQHEININFWKSIFYNLFSNCVNPNEQKSISLDNLFAISHVLVNGNDFP